MKKIIAVILVLFTMFGCFASNWKQVHNSDSAAYVFVYHEKDTNSYMTCLKTNKGYDLMIRYMNEKVVQNNPKSNIYWEPMTKKEVEEIKDKLLNMEDVSWENVIEVRGESK